MFQQSCAIFRWCIELKHVIVTILWLYLTQILHFINELSYASSEIHSVDHQQNIFFYLFRFHYITELRRQTLFQKVTSVFIALHPNLKFPVYSI